MSIRQQNIDTLLSTSSEYLSRLFFASSFVLKEKTLFMSMAEPVIINQTPYHLFFPIQLSRYSPHPDLEQQIAFTFVLFQPPEDVKSRFLQEIAKITEEQNGETIRNYYTGFVPGTKEFDELTEILAQFLGQTLWKEQEYQFSFLTACPTRTYDMSIIFIELSSLTHVIDAIESYTQKIHFRPMIMPDAVFTSRASKDQNASASNETVTSYQNPIDGKEYEADWQTYMPRNGVGTRQPVGNVTLLDIRPLNTQEDVAANTTTAEMAKLIQAVEMTVAQVFAEVPVSFEMLMQVTMHPDVEITYELAVNISDDSLEPLIQELYGALSQNAQYYTKEQPVLFQLHFKIEKGDSR